MLKHYKEINLYLQKLTGDKVLAKDLTQETYTKFLEVIKTVDNISKSYLYKIAKNLVIDKVRRDNGIAYSSVGLIWRDYGMQILEKLGIQDYIEDYFYDIDDQIIMPIDALDNGEGERISMTISSVFSPKINRIVAEERENYQKKFILYLIIIWLYLVFLRQVIFH